MAVNGIEIEVGQKWVCRDGSTVDIIDISRVEGYPFVTSNGFTVNVDGFRLGADRVDRFDLISIDSLNEVNELLGKNHDQNLKGVSAIDILDASKSHMQDRAATYDKPDGERSMGKTVQAFNAITGRDLTEPEGWLLLQVLKDVRLFQREGYHADSAEDCVAYASLKAEAKARDAKKD